MSYLRAEDVLPKELIETIQQYINGESIYIPSLEKQDWGSNTDTKQVLKERNEGIYARYQSGVVCTKLAEEFSLSVKSIQRIIHDMKLLHNVKKGHNVKNDYSIKSIHEKESFV